MRKLTLSLLLSSALLGSNFTIAVMIDGYSALSRGEHQEAYALFLEEAKQNPQAAYILGMMNLDGLGTQKNLKEAEKWLNSAIKDGSQEALYNLGLLRLEGKLPEKDEALSGLELLLQASEQQFELATIRLGVELLDSEGSEFFTTERIQYLYQSLEKSFNAGNGFAGFILGVGWADAERFGFGETNYQTAVNFLEKSYQLGFLPAILGLASLYRDGGYGLEANATKAEEYQQILFNNMSMIGDFDSLLPGLLSIESVMTPAEQKQMFSQLEKQARNNSVPAILQLISRYQSGIGVTKNPVKVGEYLQQLEKINSGESLFALGNVFLKQNDEERSFAYIKSSAAQDYLPAIQWLSDPIHHAWNTDREVIAQYVLQGAKLGDPQSIHGIIRHLEDERNSIGWWDDDARPAALITQEIFQWAEKLKEVAPEDAETYIVLSNLYRSGQGVEADPIQAFEYMLQASEYAPEHENVLISLAQMYQNGEGTAQNEELAADYYLKAKATYASVEAIEGLIRLNQMTVGFKGNQALQSQILGKELTEYSNQNQYVPILDLLLDALEIHINESNEESVYAYLLADRYFSQYLQLHAAIERQAENSDELIEKRDQVLQSAYDFFQNAYDYSEQAKLHYVQALSTLMAHNEDPLQEDGLKAKARQALMEIRSLSSEKEQSEENNPYLLNEKEQVSVLNQAILLLDGSEDLQRWFGESVLPHNPVALQLLNDLVMKEGEEVPLFAIYYLGLRESQNGENSGYARISQAADQGYLPAIYYLAKAYKDENERVIAHLGGSKQSAIQWYEKGASLKDEESIYQLAELYLDNKIGLDLPASIADLKAITYYEQLQDPDYRFAKYHLNEAKERVAEYQSIQEGLKNGDPEAFYKQSNIYRYGGYGEVKNSEKAEEYLLKAADMGHLPSMRVYYDQYWMDKTLSGEELERFNRYHIGYVHGAKGDWETQRLADRYLKGDRITESRAKAREYYEFALKNDPDSSASYDLSYMNRFDQNMPLAERGNAEAMLIIGRAYDTGNGVKEDPQKAYEWLEKSANAGNRDAAFYFGVAAQEGIITDEGEVIIAPNWDVALKWYKKASDRFSNAIAGRVEEYETIYKPAQEGDLAAMIALGDLHRKRYDSYEKLYDRQAAKVWYEKSLAAGEMTAHFGLLKLLPEAERGTYLQTLINNAGDIAFKLRLSEELVGQDSNTLTLENLQLAVDNFVEIMENTAIDSELRLQAVKKLLTTYQQNYRVQDDQIVSAPDFVENKALALELSKEFPIVRRWVGDMLYELDDSSEAMQLWQEAADDGDYVAVLRIYRQIFPRYHDELTLQNLTRLEALHTQYLSLVPEYPIGPAAYSEFVKTADIEGVLDNEARAEMSSVLAKQWQKNGYDFMADLDRSKKWYQQALNFHYTKDSVSNLLQLVEEQYAQMPDNLQYLAEVYLYGMINEDVDPEDYPFDRLTELQIFVLKQQVMQYQDERDYGHNKWVMIEHQKESDAGNARASYILAENYHYGRYARQNIDKAIEYYELAGSRGDASAYNRLGNMFRKNEEGVEPDYPRALAYFEKGAALGDSNTAHLAGDMLYFGEGGMEKDFAKAAKYYDMTDLAQGNHHALAKYKQAEIIHQGLIAPATAEDYKKAFELLTLAAEYGEERAVKALMTWVFLDVEMLEDPE